MGIRRYSTRPFHRSQTWPFNGHLMPLSQGKLGACQTGLCIVSSSLDFGMRFARRPDRRRMFQFETDWGADVSLRKKINTGSRQAAAWEGPANIVSLDSR